MEYLIYFSVFFVIIYAFYYAAFVRKKLKYDPNNAAADIRILVGYYKVDVDKIGYQKVLHILNLVNAIMLALLMLVVFKVNSILQKTLIIVILMVPSIWVTYYFLAKYLKYLERKSDKNV